MFCRAKPFHNTITLVTCNNYFSYLARYTGYIFSDMVDKFKIPRTPNLSSIMYRKLLKLVNF